MNLLPENNALHLTAPLGAAWFTLGRRRLVLAYARTGAAGERGVLRTGGQPRDELVNETDRLPLWLLGAVLVGLSLGDVVGAVRGYVVSRLAMPLWVSVVVVPIFLTIAFRDTGALFKAAWLAGAAYLVAEQTGSSATSLAAQVGSCLLMGALLLVGAWPAVGRPARWAGGVLALAAASARLAVLVRASASGALQ